MKSIVFAALIAYAAASQEGFASNSADDATIASADSESVDTAIVGGDAGTANGGADAADDASPALIAADSDEFAAETAKWETETKITTTDNWDNEKEKGAMDDFSWDNFDMSEFTFSDLLNLLESDDQVKSLALGVKTNYVARYEQEAAELPEVCDLGKKCRKLIKEEAV